MMEDRDVTRKPEVDTQEWLSRVPKVGDALKKGISLSVTTWGGREIAGLVCDWEQVGLLLDVRRPEANSAGYVFLPWSSIEQVEIREVAQRRVKFLQS
jgi:hypothetical protein